KWDLKPRDIATIEAFDNSIALDVAMGGSTNTILHTLAIAREAGIDYNIKRIDEISRRVPCLCKVSPSSNYHVQDVHRAGGIHTILGELKRMGALTLNCKTVTGKTIGENIDEWDVRSEKCTAWAKAARVSGSSALVLDPEDKLGPAARTESGNLAPKPLLFFPGDARAITLWRLAAAFNVGDAAAAAALFTEDAECEAPQTAEKVATVAEAVVAGGAGEGDKYNFGSGADAALSAAEAVIWKGPAAIETGLKQKIAEGRGMVRAELGALKGTPVVILWQCGKRGEKQKSSLIRTGRLRGWQISKAYVESRPAPLKDVQTSGLRPYDSALR